MKTKQAPIEELDEIEAMEAERNKLFEAARKVALASVGAVALAQEELNDFINRLVARGEIAEKDARKLIHETTAQRRKNVEGEVDKRMDDLLERLNVPTKADLENLGDKIAQLTAKVEALKKTE